MSPSIQLYNTKSRRKEVFNPINPKEVTLYTCGPTVYWTQHIGNFRTFIFEDLLKRTLLFNRYSVKHVMNITDVGHLTSDADEGEDKMELAAKREGKSAWEIADFYTSQFKRDMKKLNIINPNIFCKATDHIQDQIDWIKKLDQKGFTYQTSDGVYFDTSKFPTYADFAHLNVEGMNAGHRIEMGDKHNLTDFALWKCTSPGTVRQMEWDSPWCKGFPGWHIECSVMATKYLGEQFDIHCGGVDHIAVHHPNEIAQTESLTGKKWVQIWMHGEFMKVEGGKMSKSLGNIYSIDDLEEKGFHPLSFRYLCIQSHYRSQMNFTWNALDAANKSLQRVWDFMNTLEQINSNSPKFAEIQSLIDRAQIEFKSALDDDLNTSEALASIFNLMTGVNKCILKRQLGKEDALLVIEQMRQFDSVFAFLKESGGEIEQKIIKMIEEREDARTQKDFDKADKIRDDLLKQGIVLEDTPDGVRWKKQ